MSNRLLAGRYELIEKIGDGGMAVVYKAKDKLLNRYIAIKILRPEFTKDATFVENFKRESQAAAGLAHQNIVAIHDVGREGNINYIVMELVNGRTLNEIIEEKAPMNYRDVIDYTKQVAYALRVAHKNKIIHRDIKPHNIMVTEDNVVKLADFGIAKAVNDATLSTGSKIIGSVHYFSPEQARGNYVDERSDIYSLGIVMYEMLTGRVPFDGDNPVTIALKHINEEITPPSEYVEGIPPALEQAVLKCTNKFQTNRFNNVEELIEELDNIEFVTRIVGNSMFDDASKSVKLNSAYYDDDDDDDDDDDAYEVKKKERKKNKKKKKPMSTKKKVIIGAVAVVLLAIIGIVVAKSGMLSDTKPAPDLVNMSFEKAQAEAEDQGFKVKKGEAIFSNDVAEGLVADQTPKAGEETKKGSVITLHISKGSKSGTVPNVVGRNKSEVEQILKDAGYELGSIKEETSTEPEGTVLEQTPSAGNEVDKGTQINIVVSDGKGVEKGVVPSVTGKTLEQAKKEIRAAGFDVGEVKYDESNAYGKGYVMWQQYAANTQLDKGTSIDIEVSKGAPKPAPAPTPTPAPDNSGEQVDEG